MELNFPDLSNLNVPRYFISMDSKGKDSDSLFKTLTSFLFNLLGFMGAYYYFNETLSDF